MMQSLALAVAARHPGGVLVFAVLFVGALALFWPTTPEPYRILPSKMQIEIEQSNKAKADAFSREFCKKFKVNSMTHVYSNEDGESSLGPVPRGHFYKCASKD
jgi:hypothetical protein